MYNPNGLRLIYISHVSYYNITLQKYHLKNEIILKVHVFYPKEVFHNELYCDTYINRNVIKKEVLLFNLIPVVFDTSYTLVYYLDFIDSLLFNF